MASKKCRLNESGFWFWCPGCGMPHRVPVLGHGDAPRVPVWEFDGDMERPTISPSIRTRHHYVDGRPGVICHLFLRDGQLQFLGDCTHELAGQMVPLPEFPREEDTW